MLRLFMEFAKQCDTICKSGCLNGLIVVNQNVCLFSCVNVATVDLSYSISQLHQDRKVGFSHLSQKPDVEVIVYTLGLLPSLCQHLEATSAFFQDLTEQNDGIIDGPGSNTEETKLLTTCFERLFSCLGHFFSW